MLFNFFQIHSCYLHVIKTFMAARDEITFYRGGFHFPEKAWRMRLIVWIHLLVELPVFKHCPFFRSIHSSKSLLRAKSLPPALKNYRKHSFNSFKLASVLIPLQIAANILRELVALHLMQASTSVGTLLTKYLEAESFWISSISDCLLVLRKENSSPSVLDLKQVQNLASVLKRKPTSYLFLSAPCCKTVCLLSTARVGKISTCPCGPDQLLSHSTPHLFQLLEGKNSGV